MKWLTNVVNPQNNSFESSVVRLIGETQHDAGDRLNRYLKDKILGEPKSTLRYTTEELIKMGMVGVYTIETEFVFSTLLDQETLDFYINEESYKNRFAVLDGELVFMKENHCIMGTTMFPGLEGITYINDNEIETYLSHGVKLMSDITGQPIERYYPVDRLPVNGAK